ncbi:hypothetical protein GCM10028801_28350 [Nocardioides maradonensis]
MRGPSRRDRVTAGSASAALLSLRPPSDSSSTGDVTASNGVRGSCGWKNAGNGQAVKQGWLPVAVLRPAKSDINVWNDGPWR